MNDPPNVARPYALGWILRAREKELLLWHGDRRLAEQFFQLVLAIRRVGSHIAQIALVSWIGLAPAITVRIKGAVERRRMPRSEAGLQLAKHGAACEAEVHVKARDLVPAQIFRVPLAKH